MQKHIYLSLLLAVASLFASSCDKENGGGDTPIGTGEVRFTVNGDTHEHDDLNGTGTFGSNDTTVFMSVWYDPADENEYIIAIGVSQFTPFGTVFVGEDVWNLFAPGNIDFAREGQPNGAVVEWRAPDGTYFSSVRGVQPQGSSFKISERADYPGDFALLFEASGIFSCTVYDENGNSKTITNGQWKGAVPLN